MACQSPENQFDFWLTDPSSGVLFEKKIPHFLSHPKKLSPLKLTLKPPSKKWMALGLP